jgi:predicted DCC family thiol-disulfide oxidoreductase YuxK
VSWLLRRDRRRALRAVPAQSADARDAVGSERAARLLDELHTYHATQGVRTGVDALAAILSRLQGWRWAGWLLGLPPVRQLARPVYHWVARHRYLLGRHSGQACSRRARR